MGWCNKHGTYAELRRCVRVYLSHSCLPPKPRGKQDLFLHDPPHPCRIAFFFSSVCVHGEQSLTGDREVDDREYELKQLMEGERFTPLFKVGDFLGVTPRVQATRRGL